MKRFSVIIEVEIDEKKYNEVESWGVEPSDYVCSVIADHAKDRGFIIKTSVTEVERSLYSRLRVVADDFIGKDAIEDIEKAALANARCLNGKCED